MVQAKLNAITLGARDIDRLRDFYKALGWPTAFEAEDFAAFETRGAVLSLFPLDKLAEDAGATAAAPEKGLRGTTLAIIVDAPEEVDEAIEGARAAGAQIVKEPAKPEQFEGRHAYFTDPEDNYWEVVYLGPDSAVRKAVQKATGG